MSPRNKVLLGVAGVIFAIAIFFAMRSKRDDDERLTNSSGSTTPVATVTTSTPSAKLTDVRVRFTQLRSDGTVNTLLVHEDGSVDLTNGAKDAKVIGSMPAGTAEASRLAVFDSAAWRDLPENPKNTPSPTYTIETGGRVVKRSDPLRDVERPFIDAIGVLGELWMRAENNPPR